MEVDALNTMEVGWYSDGSADNFAKCDKVYHPHVFVYAIVNGFVKCKSGTPALTDGNTYSFTVQDTNNDYNWHYLFGFTNEGFFSTDYLTAPMFANSERHNGSDNLRSQFNGLAWRSNGGAWNSWTSITHLSDTITDWSYCPVDSQHYLVKQSC